MAYDSYINTQPRRGEDMMDLFRFDFVTFLTTTTFNQIQLGLQNSLKLIKQDKCNIEELYSMLYLLQITDSNFKALNFCSINLTSLLIKDKEYKDFMNTFKNCVVYLSEEPETQFNERCKNTGDNEAKNLWEKIRLACNSIIASSISLLHKGPEDIL
jgi:hypothetical protein